MKLLRMILAGVLAVSFAAVTALAYQIPYHDSRIKYFFVFGEDGDPLMGAEDSTLEVVIDVPADEPGDVMIGIWDPDVGGNIDWKKPGNKWDTETEFAVYGADLLDKKTFGEDAAYDKETFYFGPYPKEKGKKAGNMYRFRLVATGLKGDDENLFKVMVSPDSAESFSENITFRLLPRQGDEMYFYPQVPAGTESIVVENYDLDAECGTSTLAVSTISEKYRINDSKSGQWATTTVPITVDEEGRLVYTITKATQRYANAGLRIKDDKGNVLPIYFRKGAPAVSKKPAPVVKPKPAPVPDTKCNKFTFDATSSYDVDKQKLSYMWDFGDGTTSTEPVVTHIYDKAGEYTVRLTVTDSSGLPCDSASSVQKVYVNTPPVAAFASPERICLGDQVEFDASGTTDDTPDKLTYMWNFGDGSRGEGERVSHTYSKGGKYVVALTVDDNSGTECNLDSIQRSITVNTPPTADAGEDKTLCLKSLDEEYSVSFDGSGSRDADGDALEYRWDFGDGAYGEGQKAAHVYQKSGVYDVKLKVDDGSRLPCSMAVDSIKVKLNKAPVADAGQDIKACAGETVSLSGAGSKTESGETLSYAWDLGDGTTASGVTTQHTYSKGGKYPVMLTVDDGMGTPCSKATDVIHVDVNSRPVATLEAGEITCVGRKVSFNGSGSKDPDGDRLSYMWNFGDGTTVEGSSRESHSYEKGGVYTALLTVDDGKGSACSSSTDSVRVKVNAPPKAAMDVVKACCVDMEQKFDASSSSDPDGDTLTYKWSFGDGATAEGVTAKHVYTEPGTYKVVLTVDDGSGTECSADVTVDHITVNAKPVPVIKIR